MADPKMTPENLGQDVARRAEARARKIGEDVRVLGERAEATLLKLIEEARVSGRHQVFHLGREIVKLGRKLEKLGGSVQRKTARRASHPH